MSLSWSIHFTTATFSRLGMNSIAQDMIMLNHICILQLREKGGSDLSPVEGLAEFNILVHVAFKCNFLFLYSRAVSECSN